MQFPEAMSGISLRLMAVSADAGEKLDTLSPVNDLKDLDKNAFNVGGKQ
jgi:hypothetical protein